MSVVVELGVRPVALRGAHAPPTQRVRRWNPGVAASLARQPVDARDQERSQFASSPASLPVRVGGALFAIEGGGVRGEGNCLIGPGRIGPAGVALSHPDTLLDPIFVGVDHVLGEVGAGVPAGVSFFLPMLMGSRSFGLTYFVPRHDRTPSATRKGASLSV